MSTSGLWHDVKSNPLVLLGVILLHIVMIALLSFNLVSSEVHRVPQSTKKTVKAVMIDAAIIDAEVKKLKQAKEDKKQQKQAQVKKVQREAEKARKQLEAEKKQLAELKKKKANEKERLAELKKKNDAKKKATEVKRKKAEEAKVKAEAEAKRKKVEAERKKVEEEKRQAEIRRQQKEAERKAEEDELKRTLEAEEKQREDAIRTAQRNKMLNSLRLQYVKLIEQKVVRNWLRPASSTNDMSCEVMVTQTLLGDVISVSLGQCSDDQTFQRSIERAVRKASPLPSAPDPDVFDREIRFTFKPR